jgi:hypothetical protein
LRGASEEALVRPVVAFVRLALACKVVVALAVAGSSAAITRATAPVKKRTWSRDVGDAAIALVRGPAIPRPSIGRIA